jgi:hypothetical protein
LKILAGTVRDTAGSGGTRVEAGRARLLKAVGARSEAALWKASDRVGVKSLAAFRREQ